MRSSRMLRETGPARCGDRRQRAEMWSCRFLPTPVSGDARAMPCAVQFVGIADAREHQQLRRVDDAAGEDHLAVGAHDLRLAALHVFDADRARALQHARAVTSASSLDRRDWRASAPAADRRGPRCSAGRRAIVICDAAEAFLLARRCSRRCTDGPALAPGLEERLDERIVEARAAAWSAGRRRRDSARRRPPSSPARRKYGSTCA